MMRGTNSITKQFVCFTVLSVLLIVAMVGQAHAGPSYTTTMSFFQGFDLEEGTRLLIPSREDFTQRG